MAENKEPIHDPYDELKGYFPKGLDLSPEELEKEIAIENKQRDIALNMTAPKPSADDPEPEIKVSFADDAVPESKESEESAVTDETDEEVSEVEEDENSWIPPVAEEVTDNELLNKFESLDSLLDELESSEDEEVSKKSRISLADTVSWIFDFLEVFTICMACIIIIFSFFARLTKVDGPSMEDTLHDGQYLIISDFAYTPTVGDIVVLQNTSITDERLQHPLVKRIIAVGGQTVDVSTDGKVTITEADGTSYELDQSFIKDESYGKAPYHCEVPEGYVVVMGDNRNNSTDSRDYRVGIVDERCIFGRALVRILPFGEFTVFHNPYNN